MATMAGAAAGAQGGVGGGGQEVPGIGQVAPNLTVDNAQSVADFRVLFDRGFQQNIQLQNELRNLQGTTDAVIGRLQAQADNLQAQLLAASTARVAQESGKNLMLVDMKTMSPTNFSGATNEMFKPWAKKVKAYVNAKKDGFRDALEWSEKSKVPVDDNVIRGWNRAEGANANRALHDMLMLVCTSNALSVVETCPSQGFEAWRLLNVRFNPIGEMYTFDKMNDLMHQTMCKNMSDMPAAIDKFEKDIRMFKDRTGQDFPEILKMPLLLQMIPTIWKREVDARFRLTGSDKTYAPYPKNLLTMAMRPGTRREGEIQTTWT